MAGDTGYPAQITASQEILPGRQKPDLKYRPDIDGLRAVAVVPVILYHFDIAPFTGGFVGVDVFFVISGFLITALIHTEMRLDRFSIVGFYDRRIRRIAPALVTVLILTTAAALAFLLPYDLEQFGHSLRAAVGMFSNIHFLRQSGYFATESAHKPLLHTWSLSVEEQFYLGFPFILYVLHRLRCPRTVMLAVTCLLLIASLTKAAIAVETAPYHAFFQIQHRLWELMLGGVLALSAAPGPSRRWLREGLAAIGLLLILAPVFLYSSTTPFPGIAAIPPCLGAALLIYVGGPQASVTNGALAWRPIVFVGLISYSLYLWHWPLIVFARYMSLDHVSWAMKMVLVLLALGLSALSWQFVEKPFRDKKRFRRAIVFGSAAVAAALLVSVGTIVSLDGIPARFSPAIVKIDAYQHYNRDGIYRTGACYLEHENWDGFDKAQCLTPDRAKTNVLVLGDSHAAHYVYGLQKVLGQQFHFMQATAECAPTLPQPADCNQSATKMLAFIKESQVDIVILSSAWFAHQIDLGAAQAMVAEIRKIGPKVVVLGPSIAYQASIPSLLSRWLAFQAGSFPANQYRLPGDADFDRKMGPLMSEAGGAYVSVLNAMCPQNICPIADTGGHLLQFDGSHLTAEGSVAVISALWNRGGLRQAMDSQGFAVRFKP